MSGLGLGALVLTALGIVEMLLGAAIGECWLLIGAALVLAVLEVARHVRLILVAAVMRTRVRS